MFSSGFICVFVCMCLAVGTVTKQMSDVAIETKMCRSNDNRPNLNRLNFGSFWIKIGWKKGKRLSCLPEQKNGRRL